MGAPVHQEEVTFNDRRQIEQGIQHKFIFGTITRRSEGSYEVRPRRRYLSKTFQDSRLWSHMPNDQAHIAPTIGLLVTQGETLSRTYKVKGSDPSLGRVTPVPRLIPAHASLIPALSRRPRPLHTSVPVIEGLRAGDSVN